MTDERKRDDSGIGLSRRRVLGGIGAIGVASAGAALGTTAYFSDGEGFAGNSLSAGELDLKLDYKSTYTGGPGRLAEVDAMYPDFDVKDLGDGVYLTGEVPDVGSLDWTTQVQELDLCDPELNLVNGDEIPVFTLEDVKPGDSGEVTISFHICDNPAWVWMTGELTENAQNGYTEPEVDALEAMGVSTDDPDGEGQLADAIDVTVWYDEDCDNVYEPGRGDDGPVCVELVLDASGSMSGSRNQQTIAGAKALAEKILTEGDPDNQVGVTFFSAAGYDESAQVVQSLTGDYASVESAIDSLPADGGSTAIGEGILTGQSDLENYTHDNRVMVVLTDGQNNAGTAPANAGDTVKNAGTETYALGVGGTTQADLEEFASEPTDEHVFFAVDDAAIEQVFAQVAETLAGETLIYEGTLRETMEHLSEGVALDGNRSSEAREPFAGGLTQCIGLEWELPIDVGNEVQTDSVSFDVGFYAEQSRHNDDPTNPFAADSSAQ